MSSVSGALNEINRAFELNSDDISKILDLFHVLGEDLKKEYKNKSAAEIANETREIYQTASFSSFPDSNPFIHVLVNLFQAEGVTKGFQKEIYQPILEKYEPKYQKLIEQKLMDVSHPLFFALAYYSKFYNKEENSRVKQQSVDLKKYIQESVEKKYKKKVLKDHQKNSEEYFEYLKDKVSQHKLLKLEDDICGPSDAILADGHEIKGSKTKWEVSRDKVSELEAQFDNEPEAVLDLASDESVKEDAKKELEDLLELHQSNLKTKSDLDEKLVSFTKTLASLETEVLEALTQYEKVSSEHTALQQPLVEKETLFANAQNELSLDQKRYKKKEDELKSAREQIESTAKLIESQQALIKKTKDKKNALEIELQNAVKPLQESTSLEQTKAMLESAALLLAEKWKNFPEDCRDYERVELYVQDIRSKTTHQFSLYAEEYAEYQKAKKQIEEYEEYLRNPPKEDSEDWLSQLMNKAFNEKEEKRNAREKINEKNKKTVARLQSQISLCVGQRETVEEKQKIVEQFKKDLDSAQVHYNKCKYNYEKEVKERENIERKVKEIEGKLQKVDAEISDDSEKIAAFEKQKENLLAHCNQIEKEQGETASKVELLQKSKGECEKDYKSIRGQWFASTQQLIQKEQILKRVTEKRDSQTKLNESKKSEISSLGITCGKISTKIDAARSELAKKESDFKLRQELQAARDEKSRDRKDYVSAFKAKYKKAGLLWEKFEYTTELKAKAQKVSDSQTDVNVAIDESTKKLEEAIPTISAERDSGSIKFLKGAAIFLGCITVVGLVPVIYSLATTGLFWRWNHSPKEHLQTDFTLIAPLAHKPTSQIS